MPKDAQRFRLLELIEARDEEEGKIQEQHDKNKLCILPYIKNTKDTNVMSLCGMLLLF